MSTKLNPLDNTHYCRARTQLHWPLLVLCNLHVHSEVHSVFYRACNNVHYCFKTTGNNTNTGHVFFINSVSMTKKKKIVSKYIFQIYVYFVACKLKVDLENIIYVFHTKTWHNYLLFKLLVYKIEWNNLKYRFVTQS